MPGVFGSLSTPGKVKASALIQFGLLEGDTDAYQATQLAKDVIAAPKDERQELLVRAFENVRVFKLLYETFRNDTISKSKIRQQVLAAKVHLDNADDCVELFTKSLLDAGLGTENGDSVTVLSGPVPKTKIVVGDEALEESSQNFEEAEDAEDSEANSIDSSVATDGTEQMHRQQEARSGKAAVTVNFNVDSSLDTDKLQKQLALLKRFGVI